MEFVLIPSGSFTMGTPSPVCNCPKDDPFTSRNEYEECMDKCTSSVSQGETPARRVTISQSFYMGKYEVTQEEWYKVMGNNPAKFKSDKVGQDSRRFPVERVSWNDAQEFVKRLNSIEGGNRYRLPTEAEWEYAAKGGKNYTYSGSNNPDAVAWYYGNSGNRTHKVGTKQPNGYGLYDMSGNVWELVQDRYDGMGMLTASFHQQTRSITIAALFGLLVAEVGSTTYYSCVQLIAATRRRMTGTTT